MEKVEDKIVIVNQSAGYLTTDIANAYAGKYARVALIAGKIETSPRPLTDRIEVSKIIRYDRRSLGRRILTWSIAFGQILYLLRIRYRGYRIVYTTNPPIACWTSLLLGNTYDMVVYDIYPMALRSIGIRDNNLIWKIWERINQTIYRKANRIITLSPGMAKALSQYTNQRRIEIIPNWSKALSVPPVERSENVFVKANHLTERFIISCSGNMGYTHTLKAVLYIAMELKDQDKVVFCIFGESLAIQRLKAEVKSRKLEDRVRFFPRIRDEYYFETLQAADLSVVTLAENVSQASVPSRIYNLMACGCPLLCIGSKESELHRITEKYHCGACFTPDESREASRYILDLQAYPAYQQRLRKASKKAAEEFTYMNALRYAEPDKY